MSVSIKLEINVGGFSKDSFLNIKEDALQIDIKKLEEIDCESKIALITPESSGEYIIFQIKNIKSILLVMSAIDYIQDTYKGFIVKSLITIAENGKIKKYKITRKP